MALTRTDKAAQLAKLPVRPDEDPFAVTIGGFYRRWFNLVDDLQLLIDTVEDAEGHRGRGLGAGVERGRRALREGSRSRCSRAATAPARATPSCRRRSYLQPRALSRAVSLRLARSARPT